MNTTRTGARARAQAEDNESTIAGANEARKGAEING